MNSKLLRVCLFTLLALAAVWLIVSWLDQPDLPGPGFSPEQKPAELPPATTPNQGRVVLHPGGEFDIFIEEGEEIPAEEMQKLFRHHEQGVSRREKKEEILAKYRWIWVKTPPPATPCTIVALGRERRIVPDGLPVATEENIARLKRLPVVDIDGVTTEGDYVVGGVIVPAKLLGPTTMRWHGLGW